MAGEPLKQRNLPRVGTYVLGYFRVGLDELEAFSKTQGVSIEFTKLAEARQFRGSESLRLKALQTGEAIAPIEDPFPDVLFAGVDEE